MSTYVTLNPLPAGHAAMQEAVATVREFRFTVQNKAVAELLRLLDASTLEGLRNITPDQLVFEQGRLAAIEEIAAYVRGEA